MIPTREIIRNVTQTLESLRTESVIKTGFRTQTAAEQLDIPADLLKKLLRANWNALTVHQATKKVPHPNLHPLLVKENRIPFIKALIELCDETSEDK